MQSIRWKIAQFCESIWWKNYLKGKSPDAYLSWKKDYWFNFLDKIKLQKDSLKAPLIDIGCGPAGIFTIFDKEQITALDPLLSEYEKLTIFDKSKYQNVDFVPLAFEDFKPKQKFNTIFCLNAINHFIDINKSFKKISVLNEKGGLLVVSIDAHNHSFFRKLFALLPLDILHPHQYNLEEYKTFLTNNNYTIQKEVLMKKEFFFSYWVLVAQKN